MLILADYSLFRHHSLLLCRRREGENVIEGLRHVEMFHDVWINFD